VLAEVIAAASEPDEHGWRRPESLYGSLKVWPHLQRQGITVARCTGGADQVEQTVGSGVTRAKQVRTTISDPAADRAPDLVNRQFRVSGIERAVLRRRHLRADGHRVFACTAFVIDAYAGTIVGWGCSTSRTTRGLAHRRLDSPPTSRSSGLPRARIVALSWGGTQSGWAG
jgi:putative transposase